MMNDKQLVSTSKFLSLVLRHRPETIGAKLDPNGWIEIDELLAKAAANGQRIDRELLERVVADNDKQRFSISDDRRRIRANQGHSVQVDLTLEPVEPPATLYHGTVDRFLDSIRQTGLEKRQRHHVHLSAEIETAQNVGGRRGKPVVLTIRSGEMAAAGHAFFLSENGVWLTDHVPTRFIDFP